MLVPFEKDGKWGYVDYNDSVVVEPSFDEAHPTYNFKGRIKLKGRYGYINEYGKIVISPKYDHAEDFKFGRAKVYRNGKQKVIISDGKRSKHGVALCGAVFRQCIRTSGFVGMDTFRCGNKYRIAISRFVRQNNELKYSPDTLDTRLDGVDLLGRQYVILDKNGKKAFAFDQRSYPSTEFVDTALNFKYDEFMFFPCQVGEVAPHEIFGFRVGDKWGYIELFYSPREIIEPKYFSISSMERGFALVEYEKGKFGYIGRDGREYFSRD